MRPFLNVKLKYIQSDIEGRRRVANYYLDNISNSKIILPKVREQKGHVWHLFVIRTSKREELQKYLLEKGIQSLIHYPIPPHKQEAYKEFSALDLTITEKIHKEVLSIPLSAVMTENDCLEVVKAINNF